MKKIVTVFLSLFIFQFMATAQNFDRITQIIATEEISVAQAAYIAALYTGDVNDSSNEKNAFDVLKSKGIFSDKDDPDSKITLSKLCSLFAKTTDQKGGLMFMISKKSPRYAYREFVSRGLIQRTSDPMMKIKGADALGLFNSLTGGAK